MKLYCLHSSSESKNIINGKITWLPIINKIKNLLKTASHY